MLRAQVFGRPARSCAVVDCASGSVLFDASFSGLKLAKRLAERLPPEQSQIARF